MIFRHVTAAESLLGHKDQIYSFWSLFRRFGINKFMGVLNIQIFNCLKDYFLLKD